MKRILPLLLCLCLLTAGCLNFKEEPDTATPAPSATLPPTAAPTPVVAQEGGTMRLSMRAPLTLNPLFNEDVTVDRLLKLIFEPLTVLDDHLKPTSHIATLNFSSDYTSVSVTLRDDVIWSDGTPVSADDIIFTINTLRKAPENAIYKHHIDNIASCEKITGKSVKITFVEVFGGSGYLFNFPIIPQHYYKNETDPASAKNMAPLGNGLFLFEEYIPMKSMTLTQSPYSFQNRAYIEKVEALVIADSETELHAFDQGLIDVITLEITSWSRHHSVKQMRYGEYPAMYYDFIGFNFQHEVLQNKLFRQAIAHAMNMDELVSGVYLDHASRTLTPVHPASWVYDNTVPPYTYDMEKARVLLERVRRGETAPKDDSPVETSADETTEAFANDATSTENTEIPTDFEAEAEVAEASNGDIEIPPLRVLVNEENDERVKAARMLTESMNQLGLETTLEILPFDTFYERLTAGDFDIFVGGYNLSVIPDLRFAFHSSHITTGSNLLSYSDPTLDRLMTAAFSTGTESGYVRALSNVQQYIAEELPVISMVFRKSAVLTSTRIYGDIKPSADNIFANVNEWFIVDPE